MIQNSNLITINEKVVLVKWKSIMKGKIDLSWVYNELKYHYLILSNENLQYILFLQLFKPMNIFIRFAQIRNGGNYEKEMADRNQ